MDREFIPARRHAGVYLGESVTRSPNVPDMPQADDGKPVIQRAFALREEIVDKEPLWAKELDVSDHVIQKRAEMMLAVDESLGKIVASPFNA